LVAEGPPGSLRGAADQLRLDVDDHPRAVAVIAALPGVEPVPSDGDGSLRVRLAEGVAAADVNEALIAAGIRVGALVPERSSLEDVFLHLVEGHDVPR
jgi:hypothetical protein